MRGPQLDVTAAIETPTGWLELEDWQNGYELAAGTMRERAVSHRKIDVASPWVEGTFTVRGVRENLTEQLEVYVRGASPFELADRLEALTDALEQLEYRVRVRHGDHQQTWSCMLADYSIGTEKEMQHATMAVVRAQIPRLPSMQRAQVS